MYYVSHTQITNLAWKWWILSKVHEDERTVHQCYPKEEPLASIYSVFVRLVQCLASRRFQACNINFFSFSPDFFDVLAPRILARFIATYFTLLHEFAPHGEWKITLEIERFVLKWVFADHSPVQPEARHLGSRVLAKIHLRICARTPGLKCCYKLRAFVYLKDLVSFKESIQKLLTNDFPSINFQIQSQSH